MDLSRAVYSRDLKIAAMRALDAGAKNGEIARKFQVSPHLTSRIFHPTAFTPLTCCLSTGFTSERGGPQQHTVSPNKREQRFGLKGNFGITSQ